MSRSLLKQAWSAGKLPRLTLVAGLLFSAAWAVVVALFTVRFIVSAAQNPDLPTGFKFALLGVVSLVVVFLVIFMPTQWLMYALLRLSERKRKDPRRNEES